MMRDMVIDMNDAKLQTLDQVQAFLSGTAAIDFSVPDSERYEFVARTVRRFGYSRLKRPDKSLVLRFLQRVSGYSRQQLTRLVGRVGAQAPLLKRYRASRTSFPRTFTEADVRLLAHTDTLHGTLSGPATKKLMERAWRLFGDVRYERSGNDLGRAPVQPAQARWLCSPSTDLDQDPAGKHRHRRAPRSRAQQPPRLSARR
jgi:hypothetical protein